MNITYFGNSWLALARTHFRVGYETLDAYLPDTLNPLYQLK